MLALGRKKDEVILIGDSIRVMILRVEEGVVRIGIDAPPSVRILREELRDRPRREAYVSRRDEISPRRIAVV